MRSLAPQQRRHSAASFFRMLLAAPGATVASAFLLIVVVAAVIGTMPAMADMAGAIDLRSRNIPPFTLSEGLPAVLGTDSLGRSVLLNIVVAAHDTIIISLLSVATSMVLGTILGMIAGYSSRVVSQIILRATDVVMSFPSLLMAVIVLFMLQPSVFNLVIVLALTRLPIYIRTVRAEVLELRGRMFIQATQVIGASDVRVVFWHVLPHVLPTVLTIVPLELSLVILAESALSFLGIGIQPPEITWGAMVSQGREYLAQVWWMSFWPGLAIVLTTLSLSIVSNWLRTVVDPAQRWRLQLGSEEK